MEAGLSGVIYDCRQRLLNIGWMTNGYLRQQTKNELFLRTYLHVHYKNIVWLLFHVFMYYRVSLTCHCTKHIQILVKYLPTYKYKNGIIACDTRHELTEILMYVL